MKRSLHQEGSADGREEAICEGLLRRGGLWDCVQRVDEEGQIRRVWKEAVCEEGMRPLLRSWSAEEDGKRRITEGVRCRSKK